jgi:Ni,Fe-hydrogenase III large subunit
MAERYQVRGRRIWDSQTDTYSRLFPRQEDAIQSTNFIAKALKHTLKFQPLAEWQDDKPKSDPVNHPDHYQGKVECIDAIEAALGDDGFIAHCRGNAMKYIYRAGRKGDGVEDLRKAAWYLDRAIKTLEK